MGSDQLLVWWYDFHILIFIFYDDIIFLLLLMFGRGQIIPWDLGILWNEIFRKGAKNFGSLQRRKWDLGILLSDLNWVEFFFVRVTNWGDDNN